MKNSAFAGFKSVICLFVVLSLVFSFAACGKDKKKKTDEVKTLGVVGSENDFYVEIIKSDKEISKYHIYTDEITVGAALEEQKLITYAQSEKGETYISELDGKKVDYNKKEFWAIYEKNEYQSSLPDNIGIMCGSTYTFKIESLNAPFIKFPESKFQRSSDKDDEDEIEEENTPASSDDETSSSDEDYN